MQENLGQTFHLGGLARSPEEEAPFHTHEIGAVRPTRGPGQQFGVARERNRADARRCEVDMRHHSQAAHDVQTIVAICDRVVVVVARVGDDGPDTAGEHQRDSLLPHGRRRDIVRPHRAEHGGSDRNIRAPHTAQPPQNRPLFPHGIDQIFAHHRNTAQIGSGTAFLGQQCRPVPVQDGALVPDNEDIVGRTARDGIEVGRACVHRFPQRGQRIRAGVATRRHGHLVAGRGGHQQKREKRGDAHGKG